MARIELILIVIYVKALKRVGSDTLGSWTRTGQTNLGHGSGHAEEFGSRVESCRNIRVTGRVIKNLGHELGHVEEFGSRVGSG